MITGLYVELLYRAYDVPVLVMERRAHVGDPLNGLCHPALPVIGAPAGHAHGGHWRSGQASGGPAPPRCRRTENRPGPNPDGREAMHFAVPATIAAAGDGSVVPTGRKTPAHMARRYRPTDPQRHRP